eukprot:12897917-Heterocapsa_arctica.AAC.1
MRSAALRSLLRLLLVDFPRVVIDLHALLPPEPLRLVLALGLGVRLLRSSCTFSRILWSSRSRLSHRR